MFLPSLLSILDARRRLAHRLRPTPLLRAAWLSQPSGAEVWLKPDSLQRTHSFKIRGALNALIDMAAGERPAAVVTASAGNHGRALAEAAAEMRIPCVVFAPRGAPRTKLDAILAAGARLETAARDYDDAELQARRYARETGAAFVSPYNHPAVISGAGTIGLELVAELPDVDVVVVPVGGGGLVSGIGLALDRLAPTVRLVGVEAAVNPVFHTRRATGGAAPIAVHDSLADGLVGNVEDGSITIDLVERLADDLVLASETDIAAAMRALAFDAHLIVEGAGAVGVAALMAGAIPDIRGRRVVVIVSGSNVDRDRLTTVLTGRPPGAARG